MTTSPAIESAERVRSSRESATSPRRDIQALRAIAVSLVVVYHFWPARLPGGFIGVDVFFVISGFLITSHLLSSPTNSPRALAEFWGRRIRRLLPASGVVIVAALVATVLIAPTTLWRTTAMQSIFAGLYVENWYLATESVDYLAADAAASPVQHYWSLSVEEQFYVVWPIIFFVVALFAVRRRRAVLGTAVGALVAASFIASVVLVATDPAPAYFVTWSRVWELGAGGLLAFVAPAIAGFLAIRPRLSAVIAWSGYAVIAAAAVFITGAMAFPGWLALAPVLGTVLVISASEPTGAGSPFRLAGLRPVQWLGNVSYSAYLWHWPAVVLLPFIVGRESTWTDKLVTIAIVLVLSFASQRWIEDRFRGRRAFGTRLRGSFVAMIVIMAVVVASSLGVLALTDRMQAQAQARAAAALATAGSCLGAAAMRDAGCEPHGDELLVDPATAAGDRSAAYADGCWVLGDLSTWTTCHYGTSDPGARRVALIGNSHAGHWLPALQRVAEAENLSITTYLISLCYTVLDPIKMSTPAQTENCTAWNERAIGEIAEGDYDLVVTSNRTSSPLVGMTMPETQVAAIGAYDTTLRTWLDADIPVLVLRDTPASEKGVVPDCVAQHLDDVAACDSSLGALAVDPMADAAESIDDSRIAVVDLNDRLCGAGACYGVIGGLIAYFDAHHMTATFAETLAPDLVAPIEGLIGTN
ncbi:acyltransferase family protein [Agromyces sp. Leaf222]|uniref:acyltransferase family protein n=1 Tax=Agromyces sp. Leaf222 TaxID=1735688 RepID=UPI0006FC80D8|nr:acyltransferase family protein [Agromyces sp. Leaf222]KQM84127.1 hypothetical protein ASE68_13715 [Agromyces sp. Leaf222]